MSNMPIPQAPVAYDQRVLAQILFTIEQRLADLERANSLTWSLPGGDPGRRVLNPGTATLIEVAEAVATLVSDLKAQGRLA